MIRDYLRIAFESIKKRRLRSYLTMVGIFIGIAAVVSLISLAQGMQSAIESQFASFGKDTIIIQAGGVQGFGPPGTGVSIKLKENDIKVIEKVKGVDQVISRIIRSLQVEFKDELISVVGATVPEKNKDISLIKELNGYNIEKGDFLKQGDTFKVVIGNDFATRNKFEKNIKIRDKIIIENKEFEVIGILKRKGNPQQDSTIILPFESMKSILELEDEVDIIVAKVSNGESTSKVSLSIEKKMRDDRNLEEGKEDFQVETSEQVIASISDILKAVQGILIGIAAISLLVGGIGIMNTMYTSVIERTKEIGVMKAIGAKRRDILTIFIIESGILGLTGGVIGVILGISLSKTVELIAISQLGTGLLKANISTELIIGTIIFSIIIGTISGILPAIQAARLKPVEALRK